MSAGYCPVCNTFWGGHSPGCPNARRLLNLLNTVLIEELNEKDAMIRKLETQRFVHLEEIAWLKETIRDLKSYG